MGLFDFLFGGRKSNNNQNSSASNMVLSDQLVQFAMKSLQEKENRIRVEDIICLLATIVSERCIDFAGDYPLRDHDLTPGSRAFSDKINTILAGETATEVVSLVSNKTVFGILRDNLADVYSIDDYPNHPFLLPLRAGYESRSIVDKLFEEIKEDKFRCVEVATIALSKLLRMVHDSIHPKIALSLCFEIINGMSKTAPMTEKAMKSVQEKAK